MGAGGRQDYAQAAIQTLFGEQFRQLQNQAAQPAQVNQELVEQYTPKSTPVGETTEDITRRFTEGTGAVPTPQSAGLQGILDKIAAEKEALKDLIGSNTHPQITELPQEYQWLRISLNKGKDSSNKKVIHWTGPKGKKFIREHLQHGRKYTGQEV